MKHKKEYFEIYPERKGEKDNEFMLDCYIDWIDKELEDSRKYIDQLQKELSSWMKINKVMGK